MPPVGAVSSCATVKPKLVRPVTLAEVVAAETRTVNTRVGFLGAAAGMVTESMVAKLRESGMAETALCSVIASAICPMPWHSEQVSVVKALEVPGVPPSAGVPASPDAPDGPGAPCFPGGPAHATPATRAAIASRLRMLRAAVLEELASRGGAFIMSVPALPRADTDSYVL